MRILAVTNCFPRPGHELVSPYNWHQMKALCRRNDVRMVVPVPWTERLAERRFGAADRLRVRDGLVVHHPTFWFPPRVLQHRYGGFFLRSIRSAVRAATRNFAPDAVFACWAHPDGWAAARIAAELGVPCVLKVIGSDVLVLGRSARRRPRIAEAVCAADRVSAVSRDLADRVVELGAEPNKVRVVPEGTDRGMFCPGDRGAARSAVGVPESARVVLFVGNLLLSKGAGVLIEACGRLRQQGQVFSCYLVGGGKDEAKLRGLVQKLGIEDAVTFVGRAPQAALPDWYRAADVVALPSFSEGIPNVLREAMRCGRPFVATRVGGIPEITPPGVGRLVEAGDVNGLAAALGDVLASPPRVEPAMVDPYTISWEESAGMIEQLLRDAIEERAAKSAGRDLPVAAVASYA